MQFFQFMHRVMSDWESTTSTTTTTTSAADTTTPTTHIDVTTTTAFPTVGILNLLARDNKTRKYFCGNFYILELYYFLSFFKS